MTQSRFVDELAKLDARQTRTRLAEVLAAARARPQDHASPALRAAVARVEADLLAAARDAVRRLNAALLEAERPEDEEPPLPEGEPPLPKFMLELRAQAAAERRRQA